MALLGLAPHRAQGRGGELALDVLHVAFVSFSLPLRCLLQPCAAPRRAVQAAAVQNFVRLCAATTVRSRRTIRLRDVLVNSIQGRHTGRSGRVFNAIRLNNWLALYDTSAKSHRTRTS